MTATAFTELAAGLQFPEGPVAMPDGSVVVVEILGERVIRVCPDGSIDVVAEVPGVPMVWPSAQKAPCTCATTVARSPDSSVTGCWFPVPSTPIATAAGASSASSVTARWATSTPAVLDGRCDHPTTS